MITALSYPELGPFFKTYVEGNTPIPYEKYFAIAGVEYIPMEKYRDFTLGGLDLRGTPDGLVSIGIKEMNDFGKKLGYKEGDILIQLNDSMITNANLDANITDLFERAKEGDKLTVKVKRKDPSGELKIKTLESPIVKVEKQRKHVLRFIPDPSPEQLRIRNVWLNNHTPAQNADAKLADVSTIDGIIKALYDVISGPAGPRDWKRFSSLFHSEAYMAAITEEGELYKFTPAQYIQGNAPFFLKNAFTEKELGRKVNEFGNIAQVFTAYEYKADLTPPESKRGINSVELVKEKGRWYIMSISWDEERPGTTIPATYLK